MKTRLLRLISVKSIVTILMTAVFCMETIKGTIKSDQFLTIFTVVVSFYFGTQSTKNSRQNEEANNGD